MSTTLPDAAELRRLHYEREHQCCRIIDVGIQCGLWCGHGGDHLPYVGEYLPPPSIGPLELLTLRRNRWPYFTCPLCRTRADGFTCDALLRAQWDGDGFASWYEPGDGPDEVEYLWQFEPCGCEGREIRP